MAEHGLDIPDVGTALQHQRRHAVAEQVARAALAGVGRFDMAAHELRQPVERERLSERGQEHGAKVGAIDETLARGKVAAIAIPAPVKGMGMAIG